MQILIALPLLLLAIAAGFMLLAKAHKYSLGGIYKYASYFIITTAFLALICCFLCCFMKMCNRCHDGGNDGKCNKEMMMMMHQGCMNGGMECNEPWEKKMMMNKECEMSGKCDMDKECKEGGGKDCCMDKDKVKKDSVVVKTK